MALQVFYNLAFGLFNKTEIQPVASQTGHSADCERTGEPDRVQAAWSVVKFTQSLFTPEQVVAFLARGTKQRLPRLGLAGEYCLTDVERLGTDLSSVINTHECSRQSPFFRRKRSSVINIVCRARPPLTHPGAGQRTQYTIRP